MCEKGSCLSCIAYILMVLGTGACLAAFGAPFWLITKSDSTVVGNVLSGGADMFGVDRPYTAEGLLARCTETGCEWVWQNDFKLEKEFEDWQKAAQGLYAGGVILMLVAALISTFHVCCCCCKSSFSIRSALGSLELAAVLCMAASLAVYGSFAFKTGKLTDASLISNSTTFCWGFYLGVGGVVACLVASLLYFIDGCYSKNYEGYHMTRVV